jgi:Protein of unknown function (DUF2971)
MVEHVKNATTYLYHYTSARTALDHIFKTKLLRLGPYTKTNDPKETKSWQFSLGTNGDRDLGKYNGEQLSASLSSELKARARLLCFSMDREPITGHHLTDIFNRGYCKPRMWAQYADRHAGLCFIFDRERLTTLIEKQVGGSCLLRSGPVKYIDRGIARDLYRDQQYMINVDELEIDGLALYAARHLRTHWQKLFFEKMTDWRDECEWRYVAFANSDTDLYVACEQALDGIVFGEETPSATIQAAIDATAGQGVRYIGLKWKNCSPWYDYAAMSSWRVSPGWQRPGVA